ncbi:MAG: hypothetical protein Q8R04_07110 [Nanoarchaeota archaeon]|nr:hypothetical protein [Nanoarchaeota archaeon]
MKINKLLWISALILLLIVPAAFAQITLFENKWFIFAVNAFLIWVILFILQSVLVPDKPGKEKTVLWIVTFGLSLIITWVFIGSSRFIWQVEAFAAFFSAHFIVNTILISGIIYFGIGLLGVKLDTKERNVGGILLIIFIAGILSANLPDFLWRTETLRSFGNYLFGPETIKDGVKRGGILRAEEPHYRLFVFIGSAVILSWFFIGFLKLGEGNNKLSYAMAIIIAADLANKGVSTDYVIRLGEIFSIMIIGKQLSADFQGKYKLIGWAMAVFLVLWISGILFGNKGLSGWVWKGALPTVGWGFWQIIRAVVIIYLAVICARFTRRLFGGAH